MKPLLILTLILALIAPAQAFAAQPEKVIVLTGSYVGWDENVFPSDALRSINVWLERGWTVKHQHVALIDSSMNGTQRHGYLIIITLSPPPDALH